MPEEIVVKHKDGSITISGEAYEELQNDQKLLDALRAAGVDNWDGWDEAIDIFNEE